MPRRLRARGAPSCFQADSLTSTRATWPAPRMRLIWPGVSPYTGQPNARAAPGSLLAGMDRVQIASSFICGVWSMYIPPGAARKEGRTTSETRARRGHAADALRRGTVLCQGGGVIDSLRGAEFSMDTWTERTVTHVRVHAGRRGLPARIGRLAWLPSPRCCRSARPCCTAVTLACERGLRGWRPASCGACGEAAKGGEFRR